MWFTEQIDLLASASVAQKLLRRFVDLCKISAVLYDREAVIQLPGTFKERFVRSLPFEYEQAMKVKRSSEKEE